MGRRATLEEGGVAFFIHAGSEVKAGARNAGVHRVYADAFGSEFQGGAPRELVDGGFADAISKDVGECTEAGDTGNDHNVTFPFNDGWKSKLRQMKNRTHIDVHHEVVVREAGVFDRSVSDDACGVHKNVDAPEVGNGALDECGRLLLIQEIYSVRVDIGTGDLRQYFFFPPNSGDSC